MLCHTHGGAMPCPMCDRIASGMAHDLATDTAAALEATEYARLLDAITAARTDQARLRAELLPDRDGTVGPRAGQRRDTWQKMHNDAPDGPSVVFWQIWQEPTRTPCGHGGPCTLVHTDSLNAKQRRSRRRAMLHAQAKR